LSIFRRRRRLQEQVVEAKIETALARQRLEMATQQIVVPHQRLREENHFAQMIIKGLIDGHQHKDRL